VIEHLSQQNIERYGRRELSAPELIAIDDHLATCEVCRGSLRQLEQTDELGASLLIGLRTQAQQPLAHLPYEQLDAYVSETLDAAEREIVNNHLQICASCSAEADDLLSFKAAIETPERAHPILPVKAPPSLSDRLKDYLRAPTYGIAFQAAVVLILATIGILLLLLPLKRQAADLQAQLNQLQQENAELKKRSDSLVDLQAQVDALRQENEALQLSQPATELPDKMLALKDAGGTVTVDEEGNLQGLAALSSAHQQLIKNALRSGQVVMPATISEVTTKAGVLMSGSSPGVSFALQSPVGTFVQSSRPTFRWRALQGATSYMVTVYDAAFRVVAKSEELGETEWTTPTDLERGVTFRWQVTANMNGKQVKSPVPPAPEARFKVIESAKVEELQRTRQTLANSHLAQGLLYAQAGLLDDAERELQILIRANPQAEVAKRLLQSVKARRR
jgi:anti-sigma factor RsiW